jgi:hypothetical protein
MQAHVKIDTHSLSVAPCRFLQHLGLDEKAAQQCEGLAGGALVLLERCAGQAKKGHGIEGMRVRSEVYGSTCDSLRAMVEGRRASMWRRCGVHATSPLSTC